MPVSSSGRSGWKFSPSLCAVPGRRIAVLEVLPVVESDRLELTDRMADLKTGDRRSVTAARHFILIWSNDTLSSMSIQSVKAFMQHMWSSPEKKNTGKRIFRGQEQRFALLPKLFRAHEVMSVEKIEALENKLIKAFHGEALFLLPSVPNNKSDLISLAQHHGLPTRLMDWSSNPLMALFFAIEKPHPNEPTVWIYDVTEKQLRQGQDYTASPEDIELTTIVQPVRHSTRITAQSGWQMIHRFHGKTNRKVRPLESMEYHRERMTTIGVDPKKAGGIRSELKEMGIHHTTVYGDLGSACKGIAVQLGVPKQLL
jgi:hypothetical protein